MDSKFFVVSIHKIRIKGKRQAPKNQYLATCCVPKTRIDSATAVTTAKAAMTNLLIYVIRKLSSQSIFENWLGHRLPSC